jgi:hypothetical protein
MRHNAESPDESIAADARWLIDELLAGLGFRPATDGPLPAPISRRVEGVDAHESTRPTCGVGP